MQKYLTAIYLEYAHSCACFVSFHLSFFFSFLCFIIFHCMHGKLLPLQAKLRAHKRIYHDHSRASSAHGAAQNVDECRNNNNNNKYIKVKQMKNQGAVEGCEECGRLNTLAGISVALIEVSSSPDLYS